MRNRQNPVRTRDEIACLSAEVSSILAHALCGTNNTSSNLKGTTQHPHRQQRLWIHLEKCHWKQTIADDTMVRLSFELALGSDSWSRFFVKHFKVSLKTKLKLSACIHVSNLYQIVLYFCTEFYTRTSESLESTSWSLWLHLCGKDFAGNAVLCSSTCDLWPFCPSLQTQPCQPDLT